MKLARFLLLGAGGHMKQLPPPAPTDVDDWLHCPWGGRASRRLKPHTPLFQLPTSMNEADWLHERSLALFAFKFQASERTGRQPVGGAHNATPATLPPQIMWPPGSPARYTTLTVISCIRDFGLFHNVFVFQIIFCFPNVSTVSPVLFFFFNELFTFHSLEQVIREALFPPIPDL